MEDGVELGAIDRGRLEQRLSAALEQLMGVTPAEVEVPGVPEARVGATIRCTAATPGGSRIGVTVTVTEVDGNVDGAQAKVSFDVQVDDTPMAFGHDLLEPHLGDLFEAVTGVALARVECSDALVAQVGATTRCLLVAADGMRYDVTVALEKLDGADFELSVDGLPSERALASVPRGWLEREVSAAAEKATGAAPARVECPGTLEARVGATTRCPVTMPDGHRYGALVTVTEVGADGFSVWIENDQR